MKYQIKWHCTDCHAEEIHYVSKMEAAFWQCNNPLGCKQCKGASGCLTTTPDVIIDHEVLSHWVNNKEAYFWPQDDEIFLSLQPLSVLMDFIENHYEGEKETSPLIEAIPIKLYDEEFVDDDERHECINWIKNNRKLWEPLSMDYIKRGIRPKIA